MFQLNTGFAGSLHVPKRSQSLSRFNCGREVWLLKIWLSELILAIKCNYYGYPINNTDYFELRD
jgi:hypothetical protein